MRSWLSNYFPTVHDDMGRPSWRLTLHHGLYFVLLFVLVGAQPTSNFMMSGMTILLGSNWVLEWDFRRKFKFYHLDKKEYPGGGVGIHVHPLLLAFVVLMLVHLIWLIPSQNVDYGWHDIFKKLPLLVIPLVVLTSMPLNRKQLEWLFFTLAATVVVASVVGRVRMARMPELPYRQVPFISNIRFALNVALSLLLMGWMLLRRHRQHGLRRVVSDPLVWVVVAAAAFLVDFLLRIRSYTAFAVLGVAAVVCLIVYWRRFSNKRLRNLLAVGLTLAVVATVAVSARYVHDYYAPSPLRQQPLAAVTAQGNAYEHAEDGLVENGSLVNNYVCRRELEEQWTRRSTLRLTDTTASGYSVVSTLTRYLNAKGFTKDSVGVSLLTEADVRYIEQGVANPVYVGGSTLRQMYYVMFFEYECYRCFHAVKGFTMLQRLELWRNAWRVYLQHPLFGVGTGDVVDACHAQLEADRSPLAGSGIHAHNQYLTFLVSFGALGFLLVVVAFVWALRRERLLRLPTATAYLVMLLTSFLTEDTLETLAGAVFAVLPLCLLALYWRQMNCEDETQRIG